MNSARPTTASRDGDWRQLIVFDASCPLCRRSVAFLLRHERAAQTLFARLQSPLAERLGEHFGVDPGRLESVWLVRNGRLYMRSDAVLRISEYLRRPWSGARHLRHLPSALRDGLYRSVGRHRRQLVPPRELDPTACARLRETLSRTECRRLGLPEALADG